MNVITKVRGDSAQAVRLVVGTDTIYVHENICKVTAHSDDGSLIEIYEYDETQYTKDEYIQVQSEINAALEEQLIDTQLALCEIYEGMVASNG